MPTVLVGDVEQPSANPKKGKIHTTDGAFGVWKDDLGQFKAGNKYSFDVKENPWKGVMYYDVVGRSIKHLGRDEDPRQVEMPPVTNGNRQTSFKPSYGGKSLEERKEIFCEALAKSYVEAKLLPLEAAALDMAFEIFCDLYDRRFGERREEGP